MSTPSMGGPYVCGLRSVARPGRVSVTVCKLNDKFEMARFDGLRTAAHVPVRCMSISRETRYNAIYANFLYAAHCAAPTTQCVQ